MSASRKLLVFFILLFARAVSANGGDDFANNLFSDLGPLLALFGERVTMQFMSGSMGWADNIILAMAPLGIITAIVGAIRVGAPSWLKAVIGRARENLAVAEAELMSSTSQEVCELWNGQEVVRCMGSPSVTEFICLLPQDSQRTPEIKVDQDLSALNDLDKDLERVDLNINADIDRWRASRSHPSDKDSENAATQKSDDVIIIKRNVSLDAPNISLNTHRQSSRSELRVVAAFGTILQLSVLVYSGFVTYHPTLRFPKDDNPIDGYAYPCAAIGTFILVVGMVLCGHVVESSTAEKRFQAKPETNKRIRMVWLQQTKTVSDQVFGSFAIYAKDDQSFITTSRRSDQDDAEQSQSATDKGEHSTSDDLDHDPIPQPILPVPNGKDASITIQFKTVLGTMTTLTGFVLQFIGLRGLHWSASIAQLGAVFLMVCLKAWVRRGLATPPKAISLPPGYELDWFAKTLGNVGRAPWNNDEKPGTGLFRKLHALSKIIDRKPDAHRVMQTSTKGVLGNLDEEFDSQWRIAITGDAHFGRQQRSKIQIEAQREYQSQDHAGTAVPTVSVGYAPVNNAISDAQKVLDIRKDLGHLAKWSGPASAEAVSLARAIEITMNTLIGSNQIDPCSTDSVIGPLSPNTFYWSLDACHGGSNLNPVNFQIQQQADGKWKAYANEYEAVLSLWLSSVNDDKQMTAKLPRAVERSKNKTNREDDARLRVEESNVELGLRLLGLHTRPLLQDLRWWVPKDLLRIFEIEEHDQTLESREPQEQQGHQDSDQRNLLEIENHRIVGYGQQTVCRQETKDGFKRHQGSLQFKRTDLPDTGKDDEEDGISDDHEGETPRNAEPNTVLAAESYSSLPMLFAQHLFSAYMYAVAGRFKREELFQNAAELQSSTSGASDWQNFTLQNTMLSSMIRQIGSVGLGSLADIYLSVIPPLSEKSKLPLADDAIIEMAREQAKQHEQLQHWSKVADIYIWLFRTANIFKGQGIVAKATAVLMEYLRQVSLSLDLRKGEDNFDLEELEGTKDYIEKELKESADHQILSSLMSLYMEQGREWKCAAVCEQEAQVSQEEKNQQLEAFNFTDLHRKARNDSHEIWRNPPNRRQVTTKDIHYWTPVHYATRRPSWGLVRIFLDVGADVNSRDLGGYTPLHYACQFSIEMERMDDPWERTIGALIREGAEVNSQAKDGRTPLHHASMEGNERIVSALIEAGANVDIPDATGSTPVFWAVRQGRLGVAQNLWKNSNKRLRDNYGRTALHLAALSGKADIAEWLIVTEGADLEARDRMKYRPLHWAALNGHKEITELLIHHGSELEVKEAEGATPLHKASEGGHEDIVKVLVGLKVDIEARYATGFYTSIAGSLSVTPLHCAAGCGQASIVRILMDAGAKTDVLDKDEPSRLALAVQGGHVGIAKQLIENGSSVHDERNQRVYSQDWDGGRTLLQVAAADGDVEMVKLLIEHGADKQEKDLVLEQKPRELAIEQRKEVAEGRWVEVYKGFKRVNMVARTVENFDQIISLLD